MNEEEILYLETTVLICLSAFSFVKNKQIFWINSIVFLIYAIPLYYSFIFKSAGGSSFIWWFYLIALITIQLLLLSGYLIFKYFKK